MADTKISALTAVTTPATTDEFAVNQGGASKKMTLAQIWTPNTTPASTEGRIGYDSTTHVIQYYDSQRIRNVGSIGWLPYAYPVAINPNSGWTTSVTLAANGGTVVIPMYVSGMMALRSASFRELSTTLARSWHWALYVQDLNNGNSGENSLRRVAYSNGSDAWTAGAASTRTLAATSAPVALSPGIYWLAIRNDQASNNLGVGTIATNTMGLDMCQTKTLASLPDPLDFVAASWTKTTAGSFGARLNGDVFGQTAAF